MEVTPSAATVEMVVGPAAHDTRYPVSLFGVNANWVSSGFGIVADGDLLRDRSFRNQSDPVNAAWFAMAERSAHGDIRFMDAGGTPAGYPGYVRISQDGKGYSCVSQRLNRTLAEGRRYVLSLAARGEDTTGGLSVFLAGSDFMPVEALDNLAIVRPGDWQALRFELSPRQALSGGMVRVCLVNEGAVAVDEIRLWDSAAVPRISALAATRARELGIRALRWPAGTDADFFEWRTSVGPVEERGEVPTAFGIYQTPSFGLHEFLDFCESEGIEPLLTVNVRRPAQEAADLVEYVLGDSETPLGALRARHGRAKPWRAVYFELGNEPSVNYANGHAEREAARGYVELARRTADAMRDTAGALGASIVLLGVVEATFTLADWIAAAPMLADWNATVLESTSGLRREVDRFKGNFYSFFQYRSDEQELVRYVLGGGATLVRAVERMREDFTGMPGFWLTEYGVMVRRNRPEEIVVDRLKDYLAGLAVADVLMSAVAARFEGAFLFNLSEEATWGILRVADGYRVRPAGLAFSLLSPLAGARVAPISITGSGTVRLVKGDGNNPAGLTYPLVSAVAGEQGESLEIAMINRDTESAQRVRLEAANHALATAEITRFEATDTTDSNEGPEDSVTLKRTTGDATVLTLAPNSVVRISARARQITARAGTPSAPVP